MSNLFSVTMMTFKNDSTGDLQQVKIGRSWVLFFFAPLFVPLVMRKLNKFVIFYAVTWVLLFGSIFVTELPQDSVFKRIYMLLFMVTYIPACILPFYLYFCGNKLTAMNYLKLGYIIHENDPKKIELAKKAWKLPDTCFAKTSNDNDQKS